MAQPPSIWYAPPASHQLLALRPGAAEQPHAAQPVAGGHHVVGELGEQQGRGLWGGGGSPLHSHPQTAGLGHRAHSDPLPKGSQPWSGTRWLHPSTQRWWDPPHPATPIPHPIVPPFHLPLPPGVELAEVFHVDGGAAPLCCLFPAQGLEGQSCGIITAPPPHSLSTRQLGESSYASPSYLTLIQGCTRHSDAVIRSLQQREL